MSPSGKPKRRSKSSGEKTCRASMLERKLGALEGSIPRRQGLGVFFRERGDRPLTLDRAVGKQQEPAFIDRPEVGDRPLDDGQTVGVKALVRDDPGTEKAYRVGRCGVAETRMKFLGNGGTADDCMLFQHHHAQAGVGQIGGACEAVVSGPDDGDVAGFVVMALRRSEKTPQGHPCRHA
jgi:hypothetical protein